MALSTEERRQLRLQAAADTIADCDAALVRLNGKDRSITFVGWTPEPFAVDSAIRFYRKLKEDAVARAAELRNGEPLLE